MNLDPGALRLAQFLVKLCRANQLIYIDAAAAVIEQKLINNRATNLAAQKDFANVAKFQHYIELCRLDDMDDMDEMSRLPENRKPK